MKAYASVLSTDQIIQLGRELLSGDALRHFNHLAKSHELYQSDPYHTQGGTPNWNRQSMIEYIAACNGGTSPDDIVRARDARVAAAQQPKPETTQANGAVAVRIIDLSKQGQPQTATPPNAMVAVPCFVCRKDVPVRFDQSHKKVWCDESCYQKSVGQQNSAINELQKFMETVGSRYYDIDYNSNLIMAWLRDHRKNVTEQDLLDAFFALKGQLLGRLTPEQISQMLPDEFQKRSDLERSDVTGIMGGVDLSTMRKRPEPTLHSSNKLKFNQLPQQGVR